MHCCCSRPTEAENRFQSAANEIMILQYSPMTTVNTPLRLLFAAAITALLIDEFPSTSWIVDLMMMQN